MLPGDFTYDLRTIAEWKESGEIGDETEVRKCEHCNEDLPGCAAMVFGELSALYYGECSCKLAKDAKLAKKREEEERDRARRIADQLVRMERHGLTSDIRDKTFETFKAGTKVLKEALLETVNYTRDYIAGKERRGLFIIGMPGTGKTHLAAAVALKLYNRKHKVRFTTALEFFQEIRSTFNGEGRTEQDVIKKYAGCDVLVIDDLGQDKATEWSTSMLFQLIDSRKKNNRATLITTNYKPETLADRLTFDDDMRGKAIVSRLTEMTRTINTGRVDYRMVASSHNASHSSREPA